MHPLPRLATAGMLALALGACDQPAANPQARGSVDTPVPSPAAPAANAIPARFHGVWDAETGSCDPASDLRLDIAASRIGFYESEGIVTLVRPATETAVAVMLAMEGEGETWESTLTLELVGSGADARLLSQPDAAGEAPLDPLRLRRC